MTSGEQLGGKSPLDQFPATTQEQLDAAYERHVASSSLFGEEHEMLSGVVRYDQRIAPTDRSVDDSGESVIEKVTKPFKAADNYGHLRRPRVYPVNNGRRDYIAGPPSSESYPEPPLQPIDVDRMKARLAEGKERRSRAEVEETIRNKLAGLSLSQLNVVLAQIESVKGGHDA